MWQVKLVFLAGVCGVFIATASMQSQVKGFGQAPVSNPPATALQDEIQQQATGNDKPANHRNKVQSKKPAQNDWGPNRPDEPFAKTFSLDRAVQFMDVTSTGWHERKNCVTCHTNGLNLIGQAMLGRPSQDSESSAKFAKSYLNDFVVNGREPKRQSGAIEGLVTTSAMLAISERLSNQSLQPSTKKGLDYVLAQQEPTGEWTGWLKCDWPPYEHDDHFGVSLMAVALAMAEKDYRETPMAKLGMKRIGQYLAKNPPINAHQKGMLLWGAKYNEQLVTVKQKTAWKNELLDLQQDDGGWSILSLGDVSWKRAGNGHPQDTKSDAYGTGFAVFVLRQAGVQANDPSVVSAIEWLKSNQRTSGRWFVRSLKIRKSPSKHYISHAGTTFAVMALIECGLTPNKPLQKQDSK